MLKFTIPLKGPVQPCLLALFSISGLLGSFLNLPFFVFKVFFYRSRIILARTVTTLCAKLRKEKTVETVRAIVGPVSLFVGTESAPTLRITRFADNTAGTLHRRICLPLCILSTLQTDSVLPFIPQPVFSPSLWSMITSQKKIATFEILNSVLASLDSSRDTPVARQFSPSLQLQPISFWRLHPRTMAHSFASMVFSSSLNESPTQPNVLFVTPSWICLLWRCYLCLCPSLWRWHDPWK